MTADKQRQISKFVNSFLKRRFSFTNLPMSYSFCVEANLTIVSQAEPKILAVFAGERGRNKILLPSWVLSSGPLSIKMHLPTDVGQFVFGSNCVRQSHPGGFFLIFSLVCLNGYTEIVILLHERFRESWRTEGIKGVAGSPPISFGP